MRYLTVDGELHGTGVRDTYSGEYCDLKALGLSDELIADLRSWQQSYEGEHFGGFGNTEICQALDAEGLQIADRLVEEIGEAKVRYFSAALAKVLRI